MKIAFDEQIFLQQEFGGISRYIVRLAAQLASGCEVRIVAPLHFNGYLEGLPPAMVVGRRMARFKGAGRLAGLAARLARPALLSGFAPHIVHETYYAPRPRRPGRARTVITVHDMIHEKFPQDFPASDLTARHKRNAIARADHICCVSRNTRADLIALYPDAASRSSVTPLGFDPPAASAAERPDGAHRPYLLFVGQRRGYKNFDALLAGFAASPTLRADFDLIAIGGGAFARDEIDRIAGLGLSGQVRQTRADDVALGRWYAHAHVFVYPSLYEGFGIPPLEAMAAGTPVVAVPVSSVPEVCGEAAAYAASGTAEALREAVERVAFSETIRHRLRAAGSERLQLFSWRRCADDTAAVYRALLDGPATPR